MSSAPEQSRSSLSIPRFMEIYGPYAFGVISLLLIWFTIVKPQLERQQIDFSRYEAVLDKLKDFTSGQQEVVRSMERTSNILDNITKRLEKTWSDTK